VYGEKILVHWKKRFISCTCGIITKKYIEEPDENKENIFSLVVITILLSVWYSSDV